MDEAGYGVVLVDDEGNESRFEHILTFCHEGGRYVALSPMPEDGAAAEGEADEEEVVLLRVESGNGGDTYASIDNEVLLNEVFDAFLDLMDEIDEDGEGRPE